MATKQTQIEKFKEAAREHEADEDEARWDERLKKIAKAKLERFSIIPGHIRTS